MLNTDDIGLADEDDLRGFARTIAEIEWLLLILVLVYLVAVKQQAEGQIAIHMAVFFLGALILALHYAHFYKAAQSVRLALETCVMIVFITWVTWYSGKVDSPLINLYLLPIIASALIPSKTMTTIATAGVITSYMAMAYGSSKEEMASLSYWGRYVRADRAGGAGRLYYDHAVSGHSLCTREDQTGFGN